MTASDAVIDKVMATSAAVLVENAMQSQEFVGDASFQRFNIGTAICVAIKTQQSTAGVIYVDSTSSKWTYAYYIDGHGSWIHWRDLDKSVICDSPTDCLYWAK